jgi:hypothetical protein
MIPGSGLPGMVLRPFWPLPERMDLGKEIST